MTGLNMSNHKHTNASNSFVTLADFMGCLEIVVLNRADLCKRKLDKLEGTLSLSSSEGSKLKSDYSSCYYLFTWISDMISSGNVAMVHLTEADWITIRKEIIYEACSFVYITLCEVNDIAEKIKNTPLQCHYAINRVYSAPSSTISSNQSSEFRAFFERFKNLEDVIEDLDNKERLLNKCILRTSHSSSKLMKLRSRLVSFSCGLKL